MSEGFVVDITRWQPEIIYAKIAAGYAQAAAEATGVAKLAAPHKTGELSRSISFRPAGATSGDIYSNARHAAAQEGGAGPHTIAPVRKRSLANKTLGFGPLPPGMGVEHPGNPATNYLGKARDAFPSLLTNALRGQFL